MTHTFNIKTYMLKDMERFCIEGSTELNMDTTFDLVYGLWLTDTSYRNLAVVDKNGNHPEFARPSMWHFPKDCHKFCAFDSKCGTKIIKIKKGRHEFDLATLQGMEHIFTDVKHSVHSICRLVMKANERAINKIMTDI